MAIEFLSTVPWYWVLVIAFLTTLIENVFPPAPGDSILVFTGTLIGIGVVGFVPLLLVSTLGSTLGFAIMFYFGSKFDRAIMESGRFKFISREALIKVEKWFQIYGYRLIVANRFLSGTRAVISFFAGMSKLNFTKTIILSALSSLIWNSILLYFGYAFGDNWEKIDEYLSLYGKIIFPVAGLIIVFFIVRWFINNKNGSNGKNKKEPQEKPETL
ncbi:MAG: DedA family protein [Candidatus Kapabacteria bacterium]|nr:DedA family protein [Candidatus Kapabacteria bacterium]